MMKGETNGNKETARRGQVVNVMPLAKIPLYAGNSGEYSSTCKGENLGLQTISRQPEKESSETTCGTLEKVKI